MMVIWIYCVLKDFMRTVKSEKDSKVTVNFVIMVMNN
jgi:hypothetical protein